MELPPQDLKFICDLVRERAAIVLEPEKEYLVRARLEPIVKQEGLASLSELVMKLRGAPYGKLHERLIEAMTTNETSFFRDLVPFEVLKNTILPDLLEKRKNERRLHFWCGASSSGQEPYTVMIVLREHFPQLSSWKVQFVATDLSTEMVRRCQEGKYSQLEVNRGLPANLLVKYFAKKGLMWQVNDDIRNMIEFRQMNLIGKWLTFPKLDVVF